MLIPIHHVDLEITQNGTTRKHRFTKNELPRHMSKHGGYGQSYIKVTETGFLVGDGSGNWGPDFKDQYGLLFAPCLGLLFIGGIIGLVYYLSNQKKRSIPQDKLQV